MTKTRDKFAHAVANWVLNTFGTREYCERLKYTYTLGMWEQARLKEENKTRAMLGNEDYV